MDNRKLVMTGVTRVRPAGSATRCDAKEAYPLRET
jgi:hypothetical protein